MGRVSSKRGMASKPSSQNWSVPPQRQACRLAPTCTSRTPFLVTVAVRWLAKWLCS